MALFVLIACIYMLHSTSNNYLSDMRKDRDDMVVSLRQAQTPEPQIAALSQAFDRITSNVHGATLSFFAFTSVMLVTAFAMKCKE